VVDLAISNQPKKVHRIKASDKLIPVDKLRVVLGHPKAWMTCGVCYLSIWGRSSSAFLLLALPKTTESIRISMTKLCITRGIKHDVRARTYPAGSSFNRHNQVAN
jgi:hypothetical protein